MTIINQTQIATKHENPRSTGNKGADAYCKTSNEINFNAEAAELARCARLNLRTPHIQPAELISFDVSANMLTTRRIMGDELFLALWNPTGLLGHLRGQQLPDRATLFQNIEELGQWLSHYHLSSKAPGAGTRGNPSLTSLFHQKLDDTASARLFSRRKIERLRHRCIGPLGGTHDDQGGFSCQIHGDFIVYNLLLDQELNLHVLDFGDTRIGNSLEDVARFYSQLWAMAQTNSERRRLFLPLLDRFLIAYGLTPDIVATPRFQALMAYNFVVHLNAQHSMTHLLSWNSRRELNQITQAGLHWVEKVWMYPSHRPKSNILSITKK